MSENTFECEACGDDFPVTTTDEVYPDCLCEECFHKIIDRFEGTAIGALLAAIASLDEKETLQ